MHSPRSPFGLYAQPSVGLMGLMPAACPQGCSQLHTQVLRRRRRIEVRARATPVGRGPDRVGLDPAGLRHYVAVLVGAAARRCHIMYAA